MNALALFAGYDGFGLGLSLVVPRFRPVAFVEREAYVASLLAQRMEDQVLVPAPIWPDVRTFDGGPWRGLVDILTAGFPCQPWSSAGKGEGTADQRWLWPSIARVLREVRPRLIMLENVRNLARRGGIGHVLCTLASLGYSAEWGVFRASDVGAPHQRERLFLLAWDVPNTIGHALRLVAERIEQLETIGGYAVARDVCSFNMAYTDNGQLEGKCETCNGSEGITQRHDVGRRGTRRVDDTDGEQPSITTEKGIPHDTGASVDPWPPRSNDADGWQRYLASHPHAEPAILRNPDGDPTYVDELRTIGNGVVPGVVALAFVELLCRASMEVSRGPI